jgi:hypothetical protein
MATYVEYRVVGASKVQNFLCYTPFFFSWVDAIGNIFLQLTCHYFWPRLIALPKNTLPICKDTGILFHYWCCKIQNEEGISKTDLEPAKKTQFIYIVFLTLANYCCCCCSCKKTEKRKKIPKPMKQERKYTICVCNICKVLLLLLFIAKTKSKSKQASKQARKHSIMLCDIC